MLNKERKELEYAQSLDINLWVYDDAFNKYIDNLTNRLCKKSVKLNKLKKSTAVKHLKIMVLNLWCVWIEDKKKYLYASRDYAYFSNLQKRYNPNGYSRQSILVMDALVENKFVEIKIGQYRDKLKRRTRLRATPKLIKEIIKKFKIKPSVIQLARNAECIILRNEEKLDAPYKDTKRIKEMRNNLIEYNNLLRRTHIDIPTFPARGIKQTSGTSFKINFEDDTNKFTRRIFSNNSFKDGGRFYGGWWQQVPNRKIGWRSNIRINNKPTIEIDYSGIHIVFLYAKKKIDYWNEVAKDPYDLSSYGYVMDKKLRSLLKVVLLTSINCEKGKKKDLSIAKKSVQFEINMKRQEEFGWVKKEKLDLEKLIEDFADYHKPIRQYFYSGKGVSLQYIDSLVAEKLINHFTKLNIPILCIHDSFIIQNKYAIGDGDESLEFLMWCYFEEVIKKENKIYAFGQLKSAKPENAIGIVKNQREIKSQYWGRVKRHKKRKYIINWYSTN
tara:strand:- start:2934 stop:4430 length:1497 start_codon:yes stop_codon:yes gene_type:complete